MENKMSQRKGTDENNARNYQNCVVEENSSEVDTDTSRVKVKQRLGLFTAIAIIMGSVIGSGIFISPKGALQQSGSVGMSLLLWTVSGIMSLVLALVYAELGVMLPTSGGDYTFIRLAIGSAPAFLVVWAQIVVINSGGRAVLALVFADYLCAPIFGNCGAPDNIRKTLAAVKLITMAITNTISVRLVASLQGLFITLKVSVLLIIVIGGLVKIIEGKVINLEDAFKGSKMDMESITLAVYSCMWAYTGYGAINEIAEEIIAPKKNIPKALVISLLLITSIYVATNLSYSAVLPKKEFLSVPAVAFRWGETVLGPFAIIIPIGVVISVYGASNGAVFSDSRIKFACSRAGHLPEVLSFLHHKSRIPVAALWFNTMCSIIMLVPADISELINLVSFVYFFVVGLSMISCCRLRYLNQYHTMGDFRLPVVIPVLAAIICIFMVVSPLISNPRIEFLYGILIMVSGLVVYFPFVHFQLKLPGIDCVTKYIQLLLEICPTVVEEKL